MKQYVVVIIWLSVTCLAVGRQTDSVLVEPKLPSQWSVNGYVTNMQTAMFRDVNAEWINDNLVHNRINLKWTDQSNRFTFGLELRNRLFTGETVKLIENYAGIINAETGFFKLSHNFASRPSYVVNSKIDRLYLDYQLDKLQVRVGRQRINWGQCMAWNPNDIFNAYSFFDVDYIERPGSDAIRVQYYTDNTASVELAAKLNRQKEVTAAAMYKFALGAYDMQLLAGVVDEADWVVGTGWSGHVSDAAFRGEVSYFRLINNFSKATGVWAISLGSDYVFKNGLLIQAEMLLNNAVQPKDKPFDIYTMDISAKKLSFSNYTMMMSVSKAISPLWNAGLTGVAFPDINAMYVSPNVSYSLSDNTEISFIAQAFSGRFTPNETMHFFMNYLRLKMNF